MLLKDVGHRVVRAVHAHKCVLRAVQGAGLAIWHVDLLGAQNETKAGNDKERHGVQQENDDAQRNLFSPCNLTVGLSQLAAACEATRRNEPRAAPGAVQPATTLLGQSVWAFLDGTHAVCILVNQRLHDFRRPAGLRDRGQRPLHVERHILAVYLPCLSNKSFSHVAMHLETMTYLYRFERKQDARVPYQRTSLI